MKITEKMNDIPEQKFVITEVLDAPRALVFKVWAEAEHLVKWWGPKGLKLGKIELDFRAGCIFHYSMQLPDGDKMWGKFVYHEILAPERIVFVNSFSDVNGKITRVPFADTWSLEMLNILTRTE